MLWHTALITEIPQKLQTLPYSFFVAQTDAKAIIPPHSDSTKDVKLPNSKSDSIGLSTTIKNAHRMPNIYTAVVTAMFAKPSFKPGTRVKGTYPSNSERIKETESNKAVAVIFAVFTLVPPFILLLTRIHIG